MIKHKNLSESEKILKAICTRQTVTAVFCSICAVFAVISAVMLGFAALKAQETLNAVESWNIEGVITETKQTVDMVKTSADSMESIDYKKISSALERMEDIDFESLNESIKILNEIIKPLGEFFGITP